MFRLKIIQDISTEENLVAPYTLIDFFPKDFLMVVDESHIAIPQIRGQYEGDKSRKSTL